MTAPIIHVSHTSAPLRAPVWYEVAGLIHASDGVRIACGANLWRLPWLVVGPIEAVDRALACEACLIATGATEAELAGGWRP